jgi:endonuclease-3 related protein
MTAYRRRSLSRMFETLLEAFGPQHWWPADTPTKVAIGAILTQNTAWKNVEKAIVELNNAGALDFRELHALSEKRVSELIRAAGMYRVKARRLKAFVRWICERHEGDLTQALGGDLSEVRRQLLQIKGIGPETADAILLYAAGRPTFVVDAYTRRVLRRHGFVSPRASYGEIQSLCEDSLPRRPAVFNEFHALLVELGKRHCRVQARCNGCPLEDWPHDPEAA